MIKKLKFIALAAAVTCLTATLAACNKTVEPCVTHTWDEGVVVTEPTCGDRGEKVYTCTVCGETETRAYGTASGNHSYDGDTCTVCGYVNMSEMTQEEAISRYGYYHSDVDGSNTVSVNDKIYFGSYPQDRVEEQSLLTALDSVLNESGWTSYGYYSEGDESDIMSCQDVTLEGVKYRAVKIDECRPSRTDGDSSASYTAENGYSQGIYWFKFAPIEWRVLDYVNGEVLLNSVKCLDSQAFRNTVVKDGLIYYADEAKTVYANNWENSDVRTWLNSSFLNTSFTDLEQDKIVAQTLDNRNTSFDATSKYNSAQNATTDKVYLLSYSDILNADYGFPTSLVTGSGHASIEDLTVCKTGTDYALCQGLRTSAQSSNANGEPCSWWMLRSAGGTSFSLCGVSKYGLLSKSNTSTFTDEDAIVVGTNSGISPAITLKIGR
ncbi:MAG: DUF6273 domain-containing protein [Candidatus Coproplasma sp.]